MAMKRSSKLEKVVKREEVNTSEIIELLASHDTLTKKLTCNYLVDRSYTDSDLGLLTANLLIKDCSDANPNIRSASLLALASLPAMEEAATNILDKCMTDASVHVRRVCPHACTLIHSQNPESFMGSGLSHRLYECIRDPDPVVVTNSLIALDTILSSEGGVIINKKIAHYLLMRLDTFSNCNLIYILTFLLNYSPCSEDELFNFLNQIDFCFTSASAAVIVASIKLFFHLIKSFENLVQDMLETVKMPICRILNQNNPESCYLLLRYIESLNINLKDNFGDYYKFFLLRAKDPTYMKCKKLSFLPLIANQENVNDIISEVRHFTADFQSFKFAFECLSKLGLLSDESLIQVLIILTPLLRSCNDQIIASSIKCLISLVTVVPSGRAVHAITDSLVKNLSLVVTDSNFQEENMILLLSILMVFAPFLKDTQDCFQHFSDNFDSYREEIQVQLIKSLAVNFLSWPSSLQPILSSVLSKALKFKPESNVLQQAAFVYASLQLDITDACNLLSIGPFKPRVLEVT